MWYNDFQQSGASQHTQPQSTCIDLLELLRPVWFNVIVTNKHASVCVMFVFYSYFDVLKCLQANADLARLNCTTAQMQLRTEVASESVQAMLLPRPSNITRITDSSNARKNSLTSAEWNHKISSNIFSSFPCEAVEFVKLTLNCADGKICHSGESSMMLCLDLMYNSSIYSLLIDQYMCGEQGGPAAGGRALSCWWTKDTQREIEPDQCSLRWFAVVSNARYPCLSATPRHNFTSPIEPSCGLKSRRHSTCRSPLTVCWSLLLCLQSGQGFCWDGHVSQLLSGCCNLSAGILRLFKPCTSLALEVASLQSRTCSRQILPSWTGRQQPDKVVIDWLSHQTAGTNVSGSL